MLPIAGAGDIESIAWGLILGGGGLKIRSVQSGETTVPTGASSNWAVISPVDLAKSVVLMSCKGGGVSAQTLRDITITPELHSDRLIFNRRGSTGSMTVSWTVVEFETGVTVQFVESAMSSSDTSVTATISPVDPTRSFLISSWRSDRSSTSLSPSTLQGEYISATLANPTTVRFSRASGGALAYGVAFVVEVK